MLESLTPGQVLRAKYVPRDDYATETVSLEDFTPPDCG
jgi:hypothetical protein